MKAQAKACGYRFFPIGRGKAEPSFRRQECLRYIGTGEGKKVTVTWGGEGAG